MMNLKRKILITFLTLLCSGSLLNAQNLSWVETAGGTGADEGAIVTIDAQTDSVYVLGTFRGVVDFDPGSGVTNLTSAGETDIFIQKFDADGNFLWVKQIGGTGTETVVDIKIQSQNAGNIFMVGTYEGTVDFDPSPTKSSNLATGSGTGNFYLEMTSKGELTYVQDVAIPGTNGSVTVTDIDIASFPDNVFITGAFTGTVDFDPSATVNNITSSGGKDIFIQSLNPTNGDANWVKTIGGTGNDTPVAIASSSMGQNLFITGNFEGTVDFNSGTTVSNLTAVGKEDVFVLSVAKSSGDYGWAVSVGGKEIENAADIIVSNFAGVFITGFYQDTVDFNPSATAANKLIAQGERDAFLLRLDDRAGSHLGSSSVGKGASNLAATTPKSIALDFNGSIYVAGYFKGTVDFDPSTGVNNITSQGGDDAFLVKVDANIDFQWAKSFGSTGTDRANSISINHNNPDNTPYITGSFSGTVDFNPNLAVFNKTSGGNTDIFVEKLSCSNFVVPVTKNGNMLTAVETGGAYKWLNCNNNAPVSGATAQSFTPTVSGSYSVEFTKDRCKDTSACITIASIPIATGFNNLYGGVIKGTDLYVSDYNLGLATASEIFKIDLSVNPAAKTSFKSGVRYTNGIAVLGDDMYFVNYGQGKVSKINISSKQQTEVVTGLQPTGTHDIKFKGNELYISMVGSIVKVDVTGTLPITSSTDVVTGLGQVQGIVFKGDELYFSAVASGKILKKDVTTTGTIATEVVSGLTDPNGLVFDGNYLYISEESTGKILRINLEANPIVTKEVATGLSNPNGLVIKGDTLYVMEDILVSKMPLPCPDEPIVTVAGATLTTSSLTGATYRWLDCDNANAPLGGASTSESYTATASGNYAVEVTKNTCVDTSICMAVTVNTPCTTDRPAVTVAGATLSINTIQGAMYQWLDCDNANAPIMNETTESYTATASGNYAVEVTRTSGCKDTSVCTAATVNTPCTTDRPAVTVAGATLSINTIQGATYQWLDCDNANAPIMNETTESYTATASGNYAVEVTRTSGCKDTSVCTAATVNAPCTTDRPAVTVAGATLSINTIQGATYQWLDCDNANAPIMNETTESYTATASGNYAVEVTRTSGCKDTSLCMAATVGPCTTDRPVVTVAGAVLSINTIQGATYQWLDCDNANAPLGGASTTESYTATASGNYSVEVTRTSGCKDTSVCTAATVNTPCTTDRPAVTVAGATLSINAIQGATYQWLDCDNANAPIMNETNATYTATASGNYSVEVTRTSGCKDTSVCTAATVNTPCTTDRPMVTLTGSTLSTNTVNGASFRWLNCNNANSPIGVTTNSFTVALSGSYSVEITRSNGCLDTSICMVACVASKPQVTKAGTDFLSINPLAGATYQWLDCDNNNAPIMNETNATYTATARGNYSVEVTSNGGVCKDTSVCIAVTIPCGTNRPVVTVAGATLSINAIQGATYQWLDCDNNNAPLGGASTSETYTALKTGSYSVEILRGNGCKDTSLCMAAIVTPCTTDRPVVTVAGATLSINAIQGATYQWLDCDNNNAVIAGETNVSYTATVNGMYSVEVIRANNCKDTSVCMEVKGVGLVENTFATDLKLYPNPTSDNVTIELGNNYSDMVIEITNILGQVVTSKSIPTVTNRKIVLPINASNGIYFVRIQAKEGFASFRVVKK